MGWTKPLSGIVTIFPVNRNPPISGKRVLVTGANGFIGRHLCRRLMDYNCPVAGIDRKSTIGSAQSMVLPVDLLDQASLQAVVRDFRPEVVYHLAALVTARQEMSLVLPMLQDNLVGSVNLMIALADVGVKSVVMMGSAEEPRDGKAPTSPYAASKSAARLYARMFTALYRLPVVFPQLFMSYGPGQHPSKLVPYAILRLLNGKTCTISSARRKVDFIYVEDVVSALIAIAETKGLEGQTLYLGSGTLSRVRDIVLMIARLTNADESLVVEVPPDRVAEKTLSLAKHRPAGFNWQPAWQLEHGLSQTIAWYREHLEEFKDE